MSVVIGRRQTSSTQLPSASVAGGGRLSAMRTRCLGGRHHMLFISELTTTHHSSTLILDTHAAHCSLYVATISSTSVDTHMATMHSRCGHSILQLWLLAFFLFFPRPFSERSQSGCLPYFHKWCGLSANLECRSETCCIVQHDHECA